MKTILVVEDDAAIAELLSLILEEEGFRIVQATNGQEALELLAQVRPQLVITDLMMPLVDGVMLYRAMQEEHHYRSIPLLLISTASPTSVPRDMCHLPFIPKPFQPEQLVTVIETLLNHVSTSLQQMDRVTPTKRRGGKQPPGRSHRA